MALQAARFEEGSDLPLVVDGCCERGEMGASEEETGGQKRSVALGHGADFFFHDAIRLEGRLGAAGSVLSRSAKLEEGKAPRLVIVLASAIFHSISTSILRAASL
jgi:hypothetical protein